MTHDLDHDLRALDPTRHNTNGLSDRALDDLHHIMSTPPGDPTGPEYAGGRASRPPRRSRWVTRALPIGAAAAVLALIAPNLYNNDSAFASWTAQPAAPAVDDVAEAGRVCSDFWASAGYDTGQGQPSDPAGEPLEVLPDLTVALAEQRGDWTYTIMTTSDDQYVDCMIQFDVGLLGKLLGAEFSRGAGGLEVLSLEGPDPDTIQASMYGGTGNSDDVVVMSVSGRAGGEVASVVAHTPTTGDVQATVHDGFWAAWWPEDLEGPSLPQMDGLTFTVTLRDGSSSEAAYEDIAAWNPTERQGLG